MPYQGQPYRPGGDTFADALSQGLGQTIPMLMQRKWQIEQGNVADAQRQRDLMAQREFARQQKQDQYDFMGAESRNRMAEGLLAQTQAPAGDVMEALPVASDPAQMDRLKAYLSQMGPRRDASRDASTPSPFPGLSPFDATVKSQNVGNTLGMKRERFNPNTGRGGGKEPDFSTRAKRVIAAYLAGKPKGGLNERLHGSQGLGPDDIRAAGQLLEQDLKRKPTLQEAQAFAAIARSPQ